MAQASKVSSGDLERVSVWSPTQPDAGKTVVTLMKGPFFPVSERTSPSVTPSRIFPTTLVTRTLHGNVGNSGDIILGILGT